MPTTVTIPLSWANNIPGVSGIQDAVFDVPRLEEIDDLIVENTLDRTDVDEAVLDAVDDLAGDLVDAIEANLPDVDFPEVDVFAQAFIQALTDLDGFFGPIEEDFQRALQDVLGDPDQLIEGLAIDFSEVTDVFDELTASIDDLDVPSLDDIDQSVSDTTESVLRDLLPDWITQPILETAQDLANQFLESQVSDESQQRLQEQAEKYRP